MPLVSVNVLCYNQAPYIKQRIDTILSQTFTDYELVIWDDASTDASRNIIEAYRDHSKITDIIYSNSNSGCGYNQWQKAIERCKCKYLWIAEGDDFAGQDFLETTVYFLEYNSSAAFVETDSFYIQRGKEPSTFSQYRNQSFPKPIWHHSFVLNGQEFLRDHLRYGNCIINVSGVLFRAQPLKEIIEVLNDYKYSGDWALYIELCKKWNVGYIHEAHSNFRVHENNLTKTGILKGELRKENFNIINALIKYFKISGRDKGEYIASMNRYISVFGVPFLNKISLLVFFLRKDFGLSIKGLYFNFRDRFVKH